MRAALALLCGLFLVPWCWADTGSPIEQATYRFPSVQATHGMVVSAEGLATASGVEVLRKGGNAVDAAVTTAFTLAVTLPRAGNLGGGGFMVIRGPKGDVMALDFREVAPAGATKDMYLDAKGEVDRDRATLGALSVGVPGTVAGLDEALKRYGTITLAQAAGPARRLAADGFEVPDWLSEEVDELRDRLTLFPSTKAIFFPHGKALPTGSRWVQKDLAWSLEQIQKHGRNGFYRGPLAERLALAVKRAGGLITTRDLEDYKAVWRQPIHGTYRGFDIYSMPPPSSGGVHLIQALNVLEGFAPVKAGANSALPLHQMVETLRQCYADRSKWLGDPDFVKIPVAWLTSKSYAAQIREAIPPQKARSSAQVSPGKPPAGWESDQTTHLCAVDQQGCAVSLTYTLNFSYGSMLVAEGTGILLNDEMDDFSAAPGKPNAFGLLGGAANAVEAHKRPLSSMTPTIVSRDGKLYAALGTPGGSRIITIVLQLVMNLIDYGYNSATAVAEPRAHHQWYPDQVELEQGFSLDTTRLLQEWGYKVVPVDTQGDAMVIKVRPDGKLEGGVDPRRAGGSAQGW